MNIEQAQKRVTRLLGHYREELAEIERSLTNRRDLPDDYRMERRFRFNYVQGVINGVTEAKVMLDKIDQGDGTPGKESFRGLQNG
jgi:hypothetical protein